MALLKGIPITLYNRVQTGVDAFNAPTYEEISVVVDNVLICPVSTEDITEGLQLYGKRAVYELCIPKKDTNNWENRVVEFYGQKWQTFGIPLEWMEALTPGIWNRKVKVARYG